MKWNNFFVVVMLILVNIIGISGAMAEKNMLGNSIKSSEITNSGVIAIIGASYAQHWQPEMMAGLQVVNKGMEGEQTAEMLARFDKDVIGLPEVRAVVIWGFINDIFRTNDRSLIKSKLEQSRENIKKMVLMAKNNNIIPIVVTELTVTSPDKIMEHIAGFVGGILGKESYQQYVNGLVMDMNIWLRKYAVKEKILVLDFQQVLADSNGRRKREYAKKDGSHLNDKAYQALNKYVQMVDLKI